MAPQSAVYRDLAYVFVAALLGGLLAQRLRQPLILGYVVGGIIIGPFTPGPTLSELHVLELFADIGVILLMYSIGMEFSLKDLAEVKWVSIVGGPAGIVAIILLTMGTGHFIGWKPLESIAIGAVISLASTMVLTRLLMDRGELHSTQGRAMVGITLVDDLIFVIMMVLLPSLSTVTGGRLLGIAVGLGKAFLILAPVAIAAVKIVPALMARVADTANQELRVLITLGLGFAIAAATSALGLSVALGAFLAGLIVSESNVATEMLHDLVPFRNAFTALFFVTIGALIQPRALFANPLLLGTLVLLVVVGKFLIWSLIVRAFRYPVRTSVLVAVGLTQIGEFSYVLDLVARDAGLVDSNAYSATLAASLITILLNAFLMRAVPAWLRENGPPREPDPQPG